MTQKHQQLIDFSKPIDDYQMVLDATERQAGKSVAGFEFQNGLKEKTIAFSPILTPSPMGLLLHRSKYLLNHRLHPRISCI